jgi:hypothetical protein
LGNVAEGFTEVVVLKWNLVLGTDPVLIPRLPFPANTVCEPVFVICRRVLPTVMLEVLPKLSDDLISGVYETVFCLSRVKAPTLLALPFLKADSVAKGMLEPVLAWYTRSITLSKPTGFVADTMKLLPLLGSLNLRATLLVFTETSLEEVTVPPSCTSFVVVFDKPSAAVTIVVLYTGSNKGGSIDPNTPLRVTRYATILESTPVFLVFVYRPPSVNKVPLRNRLDSGDP